MAFLRNSCIAAIILMALPMPVIDQSVRLDSTSKLSAFTDQLMISTTRQFADMRSLCELQPAWCTKASDVMARIEARAQYSVGIITEWANETAITTRSTVADYQAFADQIMTGSISLPAASAEVPALRGAILHDAAE